MFFGFFERVENFGTTFTLETVTIQTINFTIPLTTTFFSNS
jgi:hypothetical protein